KWERMIRHVRAAAKATGRRCRIQMDLAGPHTRVLNAHLPAPARRVVKGTRILLHASAGPSARGVAFAADCSVPELLDQLAPGASVWINDGHIGAKVVEQCDGGVVVEVFHARAKGEKFRDNMGLNFPDTAVKVSPLTRKDLADLDFICTHADLLGYSFVQEPEDMDALLAQLRARRRLRPRGRPLGIVAKIET